MFQKTVIDLTFLMFFIKSITKKNKETFVRYKTLQMSPYLALKRARRDSNP